MSITNAFDVTAMLQSLEGATPPPVENDFVERRLGLLAFDRQRDAHYAFLTDPVAYMKLKSEARQRHMDSTIRFAKSTYKRFEALGFPDELGKRYALTYAKQLLAMYMEVHALMYPDGLEL